MASWLYERTGLLRRPLRPLSVLLLTALLMVFPCMLTLQEDAKRAALENALDTIPVSVVLSDVTGARTEELGIPRRSGDLFFSDEYYYKGEKQPRAISSYLCGVLAKGSVCYSIGGKGFTSDNKLTGLNDIEAEKAFTHIGGRRIDWARGEGTSLFHGSRRACVIPETMLEGVTSSAGGDRYITLELKPYPNAQTMRTEVTLKIAGTHNGDASDIFCPLALIKELCLEMEAPMRFDSLRAQVRENRELDELRGLLDRHFAQVDPFADPYEYSREGIDAAVVIHDEQLESTVGAVERDLRTIGTIRLPMLIAECLAAGLAAFFLIRVRRRELASALSMGAGRGSLIFASLAETAALLLLGAGIKSCIFGVMTEAPAALAIGLSSVCGALASSLAAVGRKSFYLIRETE